MGGRVLLQKRGDKLVWRSFRRGLLLFMLVVMLPYSGMFSWRRRLVDGMMMGVCNVGIALRDR